MSVHLERRIYHTAPYSQQYNIPCVTQDDLYSCLVEPDNLSPDNLQGS